MNRRVLLYTVIIATIVAAATLFVFYGPIKVEQPAQSSGVYPNAQILVEPSWLDQHKNDSNVRIIDVRQKSDYDGGHITGAVNLDYRLFQTASVGIPYQSVVSITQFEDLVGSVGVTPSTTVILYGSNDNLEAAFPFWAFQYFGHKDVRLLNGGLQRWISENGVVDKVWPQLKMTKYNATVQDGLIASADWILQNLNSTDVKILDVRSSNDYSAGHIPGAVNIDWVNAKNEDGTFKSADALLKIYRDAGVTSDKEIVVYCHDGLMAAHTYFALQLLGYQRVRVYDRSWYEWSNRSGFPIEK